MKVLRDNKESLMAVLEAFVYDPLINWRLLTSNTPSLAVEVTENENKEDIDIESNVDFNESSSISESSNLENSTNSLEVPNQSPRGLSKVDFSSSSTSVGTVSVNQSENSIPDEALNDRAVSVIQRINNKLEGRDFDQNVKLDYEEQVRKLINQATSIENLCRSYAGWLPLH
jgi:serine/threonine-protein kinase mTOR